MGYPKSSVYAAWKRWHGVPRDRKKHVNIGIVVVDGNMTYKLSAFLKTTLPIFKIIEDLDHIKEMWGKGIPLT